MYSIRKKNIRFGSCAGFGSRTIGRLDENLKSHQSECCVFQLRGRGGGGEGGRGGGVRLGFRSTYSYAGIQIARRL